MRTPTGTPGVDRSFLRLRRVALVSLCITEVVSWGVLYYAFPVLLADITADTGWSSGATSAAFSGGLVVSALVGIPVGRWIDRFGPRLVMTAGSVLAIPAMVAVATASTLTAFFVAWIVAGIAMAAVLYPPAFAAITHWFGSERLRGLLVLTLVAGLSSTIFAPLTALLAERFSWRTTYLLLTTLLIVTAGVHAFGLRAPWTRVAAQSSTTRPGGLRPIVLGREFLLLAVCFTLLAMGFYVTSLGLVPLLVERGFNHRLAATTLGLLGAGQLAGRLLYAPVAKRGSATGLLVVVLLGGGAVLGLALLPAIVVVLVGAAVLLGAARGAFTLLQASIVADRWGRSDYGALAGIFAMPVTMATALAPWVAAASAESLGSNTMMFIVTATTFVLVTLLAGAIHREGWSSDGR